MVPYRCPVCVGPLEEAADFFACASCARRYAVGPRGVPDFTVVPEEIREAHERWQRVLEEFLPWREEYLRAKRRRRFRRALRFWRRRDLRRDDYDRYTQERLVEYAGARGDVLEVGCGPGSLRRLGDWSEYVGVDPVDYFRRPPPFQFCRAYGEFLPFPDGAFDAVLTAASFDYLFAPERALAAFRRVLKPGGIFGLALGITGEDRPGRLQLRLYSLGGLLETIRPYFDIEYRLEEDNYLFLRGRRP